MSLGSGIREKPIPDPGSSIQGQKGTGSRIRNTVKYFIQICTPVIEDKLRALGSRIRSVCYTEDMTLKRRGHQ
jgi:hypothetical protein